MEFPNIDRKWLLGGLGKLVVVWLLMRQRATPAASQPTAAVVQPSADPNAANLSAQLQAAQMQSQQGIAATNAQAGAAVEVARIAATSRAADDAASVQIAQAGYGSQTDQIIAQAQAALGISKTQADAQTQQVIAQAHTAALQAKYNADASVAISNGVNTADVQKTISTNDANVQMFGLQAGVAHDAIGSAAAIDQASIAATHSENLATIDAERQASSDYYSTVGPIALKAQQDQQDRFNTLATLYGKGVLVHSGETGANQLAGFLGLTNPSAIPTVATSTAAFGISSENNKASVLNAIFGGISKVAAAVL